MHGGMLHTYQLEFVFMTVVLDYHPVVIVGDPGADSGGEGKLNGRKNMGQRKVKNGEKSPWAQCLTRQVPNGRRHSDF